MYNTKIVRDQHQQHYNSHNPISYYKPSTHTSLQLARMPGVQTKARTDYDLFCTYFLQIHYFSWLFLDSAV